MSHVLGFTGIDNQGLTGLELQYDKELKGKRGSVQFFADAKHNRLEDKADEYEPPVDGLTLKLTIDSKIQTIVERELTMRKLNIIPVNHRLGDGSQHQRNLAMSSRPDFDPSSYQDVSPRYITESSEYV